MSAGEVNTSLTSKKRHSLDGNEVEDVKRAATGFSVSIKSEEVARQFRAATDPLTKQLELLCDLMRDFRRDMVRRDEAISAPAQGPSGPRGGRYDNEHASFRDSFNICHKFFENKQTKNGCHAFFAKSQKYKKDALLFLS